MVDYDVKKHVYLHM